jgi:hypothetical protein
MLADGLYKDSTNNALGSNMSLLSLSIEDEARVKAEVKQDMDVGNANNIENLSTAKRQPEIQKDSGEGAGSSEGENPLESIEDYFVDR